MSVLSLLVTNDRFRECCFCYIHCSLDTSDHDVQSESTHTDFQRKTNEKSKRATVGLSRSMKICKVPNNVTLLERKSFISENVFQPVRLPHRRWTYWSALRFIQCKHRTRPAWLPYRNHSSKRMNANIVWWPSTRSSMDLYVIRFQSSLNDMFFSRVNSSACSVSFKITSRTSRSTPTHDVPSINIWIWSANELPVISLLSDCRSSTFSLQISIGTLLTNASWVRQFVTNHPSYKQDSVVNDEIAYDLLWKMTKVSTGEELCPEVLPRMSSKTTLDISAAVEQANSELEAKRSLMNQYSWSNCLATLFTG